MHDHAGLAEAARFGPVLPVLVLESALLAQVGANAGRVAYFIAAVTSLAAALREAGATLIIRRGESSRVLLALARESGARTVVWSRAYDAPAAARQYDLQSDLEEAGLRAYGVHDAAAVSPEETAAARSDADGTGYRSLVPYVAVWHGCARPVVTGTTRFAAAAAAGLESEPLPRRSDFAVPMDRADAAATIAEAGALPSESGVLAAFEAYLAGPALQYNVARNVPADGPTARLSAALSFGVIGARTVCALIDARIAAPFMLVEERIALRGLLRALAERDFFLQLAHFFEREPDEALQVKMRDFRFAREHPALDAWRAGRTGFPLIDAGVRQLHATGWMHPRVRRVAASFLCFDLGIDWRVGRDEWDRYLIEDDPALATGPWQWSAGVGADLAAVPRIFNPMKQLRRFDPAAEYVRRWIPELAGLPASDILDPTGRDERPQLALPLFGEPGYPAPVLDHATAGRAFLRRYAGVRLQR